MTSAFSGVANLAGILKGLEGRADFPPDLKPQAVKRRKFVRTAAPKAAPKAGGGVPKPKAYGGVPKADGVGAKAEGVVPKDGVPKDPVHEAPVPTAQALAKARNCAVSKAYVAAKKQASTEGKSAEEITAAAKHAYKLAGIEWDSTHKA